MHPPFPLPGPTVHPPTPATATAAAEAPAPRHPAAGVRPPRAKRVLDLLGAGLLLALLAAPLALTCAALAAGAPAGDRAPLRRSPALGLAGRPFALLGLRADTRLGAALRRRRLSGLPALWNVLRGEMSLVGPAPRALPDHPERLLARPGLTGPWQIGARSKLPWEAMDLLDREYVEGHWLGTDLAILARTPRALWRAARPDRPRTGARGLGADGLDAPDAFDPVPRPLDPPASPADRTATPTGGRVPAPSAPCAPAPPGGPERRP
ncbi:sugar transferase [Streptomyces sp. BI20]|uniref:sugar transferase n=1 Tax=Streptomyces sp. BI20 TaxID=3403460 RepID=UPI003C79268B